MDQQRVEERQQRIDRVERRAARAPAKDDVGVVDADQVVEHAEIDVAGLAFGAAQSVGSVVGEADALQDHAEPHDGLLDRSAAVGRELLPVIAQRPLQNRPLIGDLARNDAAHDVVGRVGDAILLAPQKNVAADRPLDAGLETSGPIEQDDRDPGARAGLDQRRRYIDRAEDDDGAEHVKRHARPLGAVDLRDEVFAVLAQARAFGGDVERVEKFLHAPSAAEGLSSAARTCRSRHVFAERPKACGRQRSRSEQAPHLRRSYSAGGVRPEAKSSLQRRGRVLGQAPQLVVEADLDAPARLAVEQRALGNGAPGHLLETQSLRAELRLVGAMRLGLAALEFDGIGRLDVARAMELDDVGDAGEAEPARGERHGGDAADAARIAGAGLVRPRMQHTPLGGEAVLLPHPLDMDERRLPQAIDGVLDGGDGDGVVLHRAFPIRPQPSEQLVDGDAVRQAFAVDRHAIIGEPARRRQVVESLVADGVNVLAADAVDANALEQVVRLRVAERARVFEGDELACGHFAARRRSIVLEHVPERIPDKRKIVVREAGPFGELGGNEAMRAVEAVGHDVLAAHGAVLRPLVVAALDLLGLFGLVGRRHSRDGDFERHDRLDGAREGELHRSSHLSAIDAGAHDRAEGANVEEIVAHELPKLAGLFVVLRVERLVRHEPSCRPAGSRCRPSDASG